MTGRRITREDIQRLLAELLGLTNCWPLSSTSCAARSARSCAFAPDKIDPKRSLYDMGLDSLMGVELMIALEARFGIRLPVMALSQSPTISQTGRRE
jgi:phthiocerol/phenolphthiocerol synthesis type-I polyketide synthase C